MDGPRAIGSLLAWEVVVETAFSAGFSTLGFLMGVPISSSAFRFREALIEVLLAVSVGFGEPAADAVGVGAEVRTGEMVATSTFAFLTGT